MEESKAIGWRDGGGRIVVGYGVGRRLAGVFGCTPECVSRALNGRGGRSGLSVRIRQAAVRGYGGVEVGVGAR